MPLRIDKGSIGQARLDHNGFLLAPGIMTRTGVFEYVHSDGTKTRELRDPRDVFDPEAIKSFINVPVTVGHPQPGKVTPDNTKKYTVGNTGDSVDFSDGVHMKSTLVIRDGNAINKVLHGSGGPPLRELSCGYRADVVAEEGTFDMPGHPDHGKTYDHRQTNIRGNHLAIVARGRAGDAKVLLDADDAILADADAPTLDADKPRTIGATQSGKEVYADHEAGKYEDWTVQDHREAAMMCRSEHSDMRNALAALQRIGSPKDHQDRIKADLARLEKSHDFHKQEAMELDSEDSEDQADADLGDEQEDAATEGIDISPSAGGAPGTVVYKRANDRRKSQRDRRRGIAAPSRQDADGEMKVITLEGKHSGEVRVDGQETSGPDHAEAAQVAALLLDVDPGTISQMNSDSLRRLAISRIWPDQKLDGRSPEFVAGLFTVIVDRQLHLNRGTDMRKQDYSAPSYRQVHERNMALAHTRDLSPAEQQAAASRYDTDQAIAARAIPKRRVRPRRADASPPSYRELSQHALEQLGRAESDADVARLQGDLNRDLGK